jgi:DNA-3-methyladenine glycosylase II
VPTTIDGPKAIRALRRADPVLGDLIKVVGPLRLDVKTTTSVFAVLSEAIVYQQLNGRAAETIYGRVVAALVATARASLPARAARVRRGIAGAGLSRAKLAPLRDLAARRVGRIAHDRGRRRDG